MGMDLTKRQWDLLVERVAKLESSLRKIETKMDLMEKKMKPQELYRIVKQQEHEEATASDFKPKV